MEMTVYVNNGRSQQTTVWAEELVELVGKMISDEWF